MKTRKVQLNEYETVLYFLQLSQNLTWKLISVYLSACFYQFLHDVLIKLFCRSKQNNFMSTSCKNWWKQVNMQKSTNNPMWSFGLMNKIWSYLIFIKLYKCNLKKKKTKSTNVGVRQVWACHIIYALKILANKLQYSPLSEMHIHLTICKNL